MPKNASFYISDPSMIGTRLFNEIDFIESYKQHANKNDAAGFTLKMPWGQIDVDIMPAKALPHHLKGFEGYIKDQRLSKEDLLYTLTRLHNVRMCLGCEITHTPETEKEVVDFLVRFNSHLNGLVLFYNSVFDWTGDVLCGPLKDAPKS
ncbi:MAG: hypothetical protein LUO95_01030 [Methylococcaceae bacterium]|nr:hypothetical protein [Methylococcaceae bacterium]MDD1609217.1 hypothetical protein [Methylococcaceae bacterium]MDD1615327.1 hypothetical protein [Methylococcaceae bacterium]